MTDQRRAIDTDLVWWLLASVITVGAFWIGVGPSGALVAGLWMVGLMTVLFIGRRRSDAVRAVIGGGDERDRDLYTRATSTAGVVLGLAVTGWWLASVATGAPNQDLFTLTIIFSSTFFAAAAFHARHG